MLAENEQEERLEDESGKQDLPRQLLLPLVCPADHHGFLVNGKQVAKTIVWVKGGYWSEAKQRTAHWKSFSGDFSSVNHGLAQFDGSPDIFLTPNEFVGKRILNHGKALNCCFVDIDIRDEQGLMADPAYRVNRACFLLDEAGIPHPNVVVYSGRGLHLYWLFESKVNFKALPRWQALQNRLVDVLKADPNAKDAARVLRLVGSVHSGVNKRVSAQWITQTRYDFEYLYLEIVRDRQAAHDAYKAKKAAFAEADRQKAIVRDLNKKRAEKGIKPVYKGSIYERWYLVYKDIWTIAEHNFGRKEAPDGLRDFFLYHLANAASWFTSVESLEYELEVLASTICPTLPADQAKTYVSCVLKRAQFDAKHGIKGTSDHDPKNSRYKYKRKTLWNEFNQRGLVPTEIWDRLRAIVPEDLVRQRRADRERARKHSAGQNAVSRDEFLGRNEGLKNQVELMHSKGLKAKAISQALNVPLPTVYRWLQIIRSVALNSGGVASA